MRLQKQQCIGMLPHGDNNRKARNVGVNKRVKIPHIVSITVGLKNVVNRQMNGNYRGNFIKKLNVLK